MLAIVLAVGCGQQKGSDGAASKVRQEMPASATDETKVPHYFGPYPNWANSPLTLPDATVTINGDGSGATAEATVGANGAVTDIKVTNPGSGYTSATVAITGSGTGATADATVVTSVVVTAIAVDAPGSGYTAPTVTISGGGATTDATATAYGSVDAVNVTTQGTGYTFPTVEFDFPDDPNGTQATGHAITVADSIDPTLVSVIAVAIDNPGSGYSKAPNVKVHNGTLFDPIALPPGSQEAIATATLSVDSVVLDTFGADYTSQPTVAISDATGSGTGALASASLDFGGVASIIVTNGGTGYVTPGGIKKFVNTLPGLTEANKNDLGQYIPVAAADTTTFTKTAGFKDDADYYVIAIVQHRETMYDSGTTKLAPLLREYVQLSTAKVPGKQVPLFNEMLDGTKVPALMPDGTQAMGVDDPHYLGPTIVATRNKPVRIVFYNLLPTGAGGDLFLPVDSTMMGSGMGPMDMMEPMDEGTVMDKVRNPACTEYPKGAGCFKDNRATLHLHGGNTPWISDGTPHQWLTPATENTPWPKGVSVKSVPDMVGTSKPADVPDCSAAKSGCMTFYYTNQQSARLMFYHDHSYGITRLNVYAGEAAGYLITDDTEKKLTAVGAPLDATVVPQIPLVIQDRTFVPSADQLKWQDPTWDSTRWGGAGNLWYHHVYMPAQNPGDPSGMSAFGRWMYGPWFWPPATPPHGPIANPYYDANCNLDDPSTWQYQTDPFCEPKEIPGTPNISAGMEQFNDTPIVNGTVYPTTTLEPKTYRFRVLNAANDRFFNLQWYVADPTTGTDSEVALKPAELAAAQLDPVVFPTPVDANNNAAGPDWIQIGTEGGFLPAPVVVDGQQPTTWITDPTRFDVGNVDLHSLLLAPAERADVIVDFSKFAGKTLILYNDAPAAFPARVPSYDYYTGAPDLSPTGAPKILPGYGPNTRTVMQVKIAPNAPAAAFNLTALRNAFSHKADGSGVFESGQHPIIVGQSAYNSAYGTSFAASGDCSKTPLPAKCDGYARINQQGGTSFTFDTLRGAKLSIPIEPKAIHDEMNSSAFDPFGRMTANLGLEVVPATPALQNVVLYPYAAPMTEVINTTKLPKVTIDANGVEVKVTPIATADDGTQIWKITHNGVDTHPIHFHAYDVQVLNRVTWDNIIIQPDATELGWKDTVRVSPLEDTIVVFRPVLPTLPWELPNSRRLLDPTMPPGVELSPGLIMDPQGNQVVVTNEYVNFGAEYVFHCHILSHEEMDMMRPVSLTSIPSDPKDLAVTVSGNGNNRRATLSWTDTSINETAFEIHRSSTLTGTYTLLTTVQASAPATVPVDESLRGTTTGTMTFTDATIGGGNAAFYYRVRAVNTVGYVGGNFPTETTLSGFTPVASWAATTPPAAPTNVTVTAARSGNNERLTIRWTDVATNETGFRIEVSTSPVFTTLVTAINVGANTTSFTTGNIARTSYYVRIRATNGVGPSAWVSATPSPVPAAP